MKKTNSDGPSVLAGIIIGAVIASITWTAMKPSPKKETPYVILSSCDNKGCTTMMRFNRYSDCHETIMGIIHLHKEIRHDKPSKLMLCNYSDDVIDK